MIRAEMKDFTDAIKLDAKKWKLKTPRLWSFTFLVLIFILFISLHRVLVAAGVLLSCGQQSP